MDLPRSRCHAHDAGWIFLKNEAEVPEAATTGRDPAEVTVPLSTAVRVKMQVLQQYMCFYVCTSSADVIRFYRNVLMISRPLVCVLATAVLLFRLDWTRSPTKQDAGRLRSCDHVFPFVHLSLSPSLPLSLTHTVGPATGETV